MEFLVRIDVGWPTDGDSRKKAELLEAEARRGRELAADGVIVRLWRVPGRWANVGIWSAPDATALHESLSSLPLYPWLTIDVEPLAHHPSDPGADAR